MQKKRTLIKAAKPMSKELHIYHGSSEIILNPSFGAGRKNNDYGLGFYCTESEELAKEWACSPFNGGFANHYSLNISFLNMLDLNSDDYSVLNWMAVLIEHRLFTVGVPIAGKAKKYLVENFGINVNAYDVVKGNRADDAYYDFAQAFLNNAITVEQLARAMMLENLGEQIVLKSRFAFDNIKFVDFSTADQQKYYPSRKARAEKAEHDFRKICEEPCDGLYMIDIIREGVKNDDPRIPRNVRR